MWIFLNSKFVKKEQAKISVFDHGFLYGDGVYETLRTYGGKVWQIDGHLKRLDRSAKILGLEIPYSRNQIKIFLNKLLKMNGFVLTAGGVNEARIRITLTRGVNDFDFVTCKKPTLIMVAQPLVLEPKAVYEKGVKVVSFKMERILPQAKTASLLPLILANRYGVAKKAYETIFVSDDGYVREGTITNVFMVKNGKVFTPRNNILLGTTSMAIEKICKKNAITLQRKDFKIDQLYNTEEVFIANAPRGIIPVVKVDKKVIGNGVPGFYAKKIMRLFKDYVEAQAVKKQK